MAIGCPDHYTSSKSPQTLRPGNCRRFNRNRFARCSSLIIPLVNAPLGAVELSAGCKMTGIRGHWLDVGDEYPQWPEARKPIAEDEGDNSRLALLSWDAL